MTGSPPPGRPTAPAAPGRGRPGLKGQGKVPSLGPESPTSPSNRAEDCARGFVSRPRARRGQRPDWRQVDLRLLGEGGGETKPTNVPQRALHLGRTSL